MQRKYVPVTKNMFLSAGVILLMTLVSMPVWDGVQLLMDPNYMFWFSRGLPWILIIICVLAVVFFVVSAQMCFNHWRGEENSTQTLVMVMSLFVTFIGVVQIFVSLPITTKSIQAYNSLVYECGETAATHNLWIHSQALASLRQTPGCAGRYSVEECDGYQAQEPYTSYLKSMEKDLRCVGFCEAKSAADKTPSVAAVADQSVLLQLQVKANRLVGTAAALLAPMMGEQAPLALFSPSRSQMPCDRAVANQLFTATRGKGQQLWYTGVVFVAVSIGAGAWEWTSHMTG